MGGGGGGADVGWGSRDPLGGGAGVVEREVVRSPQTHPACPLKTPTHMLCRCWRSLCPLLPPPRHCCWTGLGGMSLGAWLSRGGCSGVAA